MEYAAPLFISLLVAYFFSEPRVDVF